MDRVSDRKIQNKYYFIRIKGIKTEHNVLSIPKILFEFITMIFDL